MSSLALSAVTLGLAGCDNAEVKKCHAEMQVSQEGLLAMDSKDEQSVDSALAGIERALSACKSAQRRDEVADILEAKRTISAHKEALSKRGAAPKAKELSPEQIAKLAKDGDSSCPKGQAYRIGPEKTLVSCTGGSVVEMSWKQAEVFYGGLGFTVMSKGSQLRAEQGASRVILSYDAPNSEKAATCVEVTGLPGTPWQELITRLTSVHPAKLKKNQPVQVGKRSIPVRIEGDEKQWSAFLGDCAPREAEGAQAPAK